MDKTNITHIKFLLMKEYSQKSNHTPEDRKISFPYIRIFIVMYFHVSIFSCTVKHNSILFSYIPISCNSINDS